MKNNTAILVLRVLSAIFVFNGVALSELQPGPMLVTASTTIQKDMEFESTGFVIKGSNITLDLGGHTITFNNGNSIDVLNSEFELWSGGIPTNWSVLSGSAQQVSSIYFGSYDLNFKGSGVIQSSPIMLKAGKTYLAFAFVKGPETGSVTLRILTAADKNVLVERSWGSGYLRRGYGSNGSANSDLKYKPLTDTNVVLELACNGNANFQVGMVDIKPAFDYGVTTNNYHDSVAMPDLNPSWFSGFSSNITIKNGKIVQGNSKGVRCSGIRYSGGGWKILNIEIQMNGINTDGIYGYYPESTFIEGSIIRSSSISVFNRMHGPGGINIEKPSNGPQIITNNLIDGVPEAGIAIGGCIDSFSTISYTITGNTIKQRELVTEGYGIGISGIQNFEIANNTIEPYQGRGILLDASAGCSSGGKGTLNGKVHNNQILNIYEVPNSEYDANGLQSVGIRVRNWGKLNESHKNLKIFDNKISGFTDERGVKGVIGINLTLSATEDSVDIYGNEISVTATGANRSASAIVFHETDLSKGNSVFIHNNLLASNGAVLQFGGSDGAKAKGLLLEGNIFRRLSNPSPIGKPFLYGYWVGEEMFNILADNIAETGDVDPAVAGNILFDGSGAKNLTIGRHRLEVQVRGGNGLPFPDATVTLKDKTGSTLHQDMTGANGKVVLYSPRIYYSGVGTAVTGKEYPDGDTFEITASVPEASPKSVNLSVSNAQLITIVFEGVNPPSSFLGPGAPKNFRIGS